MLKLAEKLERDGRPRRVVNQITGSGTSPGAHMFEAHNALSTADFVKLVGGAAKELNESLYWLQIIEGMAWEPGSRLDQLIDETCQLQSICKSMIVRTRRRGPKSAILNFLFSCFLAFLFALPHNPPPCQQTPPWSAS